jgi:hypothetical protein
MQEKIAIWMKLANVSATSAPPLCALRMSAVTRQAWPFRQEKMANECAHPPPLVSTATSIE